MENGTIIEVPGYPYPNFGKDTTRAETKLRYEGWPTAYLSEFAKRSMTIKAPLAAALGLDNEHRAFITVKSPEAIRNHKLVAVLTYGLMTGLASMPEGKRPRDPNDLERQHVAEGIIRGTMQDKHGRDVRFGKWARSILRNPQAIERLENEFKYYCEPVMTPDVLLARVGELGAESNRRILISANPLDMIFASEFAGFDSCHRLDGCHGNGNLAYALDPYTVMVAPLDDERSERETQGAYPWYKLGRCWAYIAPDRLRFAIGRQFGTVGPETVRLISNNLGDRLAAYLGIDSQWVGHSGIEYECGLLHNIGNAEPDDHENWPAYFDTGVSRITYHKSLKETGDAEDHQWDMVFTEAMCLKCGQDTLSNTGGKCDECGGKRVRCSDCAERVSADDARQVIGGDMVCENCYDDNYYTCRHCDEGVHSNAVVWANNDNRSYCSDCAESYTDTCEVCDERYSDDYRRWYMCEANGDDHSICNGCRSNGAGVCSDCDTVEENVHYCDRDEVDLCDDCYNSRQEADAANEERQESEVA